MESRHMGKVVKLSDYGITPKSVDYRHDGQKYTCRFDPNATPDKKWVFILDYVQTYRYIGAASTIDRASAKAKKIIANLNRYNTEWTVEDEVG